MQLVKRLITHFENLSANFRSIEEVNKRFCKDIAAPFRGPMKWEELFSNLESHQDLLGLYQSSSEKLATDAHETSEMIDKHVVVPLKVLCADLRRRAADPEKDWIALDRDLKTDRDAFIRLLNDLKYSILNHGGVVISENEDTKQIERATLDPWVAKRALLRHINSCIEKQDSYRKALIKQQNDIAQYEKDEVLQTLKVTFSAFFDWRAKDMVGEQDIYTQLKTKLLTLNPQNDWEIFTENHSGSILRTDEYNVEQLQKIPFPGREDKTTTATKIGTMLKKVAGTGFHFKRSWKEVQIVVTTSGYMHIITNKDTNVDDNVLSNNLDFPEASIYLPECTIAPLMMNEKEPEEFLIQEKSSGMFGGIIKHKFKGHDMDDSAAWWQYLRNISEQPGSRKGTSSSVSSPSTSAMPESSDAKTASNNAVPNSLNEKFDKIMASKGQKQPQPQINSVPALIAAGHISQTEISPTDFGADIAPSTKIDLGENVNRQSDNEFPTQPIYDNTVDYNYNQRNEEYDGFDVPVTSAPNELVGMDNSLSVAERMEKALGHATKSTQNSDVWAGSNAWGNGDDEIGRSAWS